MTTNVLFVIGVAVETSPANTTEEAILPRVMLSGPIQARFYRKRFVTISTLERSSFILVLWRQMQHMETFLCSVQVQLLNQTQIFVSRVSVDKRNKF